MVATVGLSSKESAAPLEDGGFGEGGDIGEPGSAIRASSPAAQLPRPRADYQSLNGLLEPRPVAW